MYVTWKTWAESLRQTRRPAIRLTTSSSGGLQVQHRVELHVLGLEQLVQRLGLGDVPRETVQQEAALGVGLLHAVLRHGDRDLVRHEIAGVHVGLRELAQFGLLADVRAEQVARGDVRNVQRLGKAGGLRSLSGTRRPDEDDSHQRRNPS
ncbi:hypothetical protein RKD48_003341 [Streptomyces ambofaciens]